MFRDDWDRLESGELYLSDCTGLDRRLDRQLIEYIAIHGRGVVDAEIQTQIPDRRDVSRNGR